MEYLISILIFLGLAAFSVKSQLTQQETYDYCDPKLKLCEVFTDHTMCKYPVPGLSPHCTESIHEPLNPIEKKRILFWHNKFRSNIATGSEKNKNRKPLPTSSNMRQIFWDGELEKLATRWAEQCENTMTPFAYDKCRNAKRFRVSQNVGTRLMNGSTIEKQAPQIVISWYKESKDFDPSLVDKFIPVGNDKASTKQFANIIWAETYALGCARVIFQENLLTDRNSNSTLWTIERLVCNYGPGGSEIGKPVYKRGTSCGNCPNGTQCSLTFPGLCTFQNSDKTEDLSNLENQESKSDLKPQTESSPREQDVSSESSGAEESDKEKGKEKQKKAETLTSGVTRPTTEKGCVSGSCFSSSGSPSTTSLDTKSRLDELLNFQRPTARKKSREVDFAGHQEYFDGGKKIWATERTTSEENKMRNGEKCKCYVLAEEEEVSAFSGAPNASINIICFSSFLVFFSHLRE